MDGELIQIDNLLSWEELLFRWRDKVVGGKLMGTSKNVFTLIEEGEITAYRKEKAIPRKGKIVFRCSIVDRSCFDYFCFGEFYFDEIEIAKYELNFSEEFQPSLEDVCAKLGFNKDELLKKLYFFVREDFRRGFAYYTRVNGEAVKFYFDGDPQLRADELKAENEALKARIAELEKAVQKGAESEEITSLRWELGNLRISLEDSENARLGLSDELEVKTLELAHIRQELEEVNAGRGQKTIDPREKKTLLKLIHAALSLEKKKSIGDRSLASLLAAKTEQLYPSKPVNNDTIKNKINEIIALHTEESE